MVRRLLVALAAVAATTGTARAQAPAGPAFRVNTYTTHRQWFSDVAVQENGDFVVVWESYGGQDGSGTGVFGQHFDRRGNAIGAEFRVNSHTTGYQMFYSAAYYGWDYPKERLSQYATGYASCTGPLGPCKDAPENPILHSFNDPQAGCLSGPGHPAILKFAGRQFIAFHAWAASAGCRPLDQERYLYIAPLFWKDGKPQIGPSLRQPTQKK